ncbi:hypothetical protein DFH09DRAFT_1201680 [Mycena vulgaris]|nr:hypothetical protein DFH09DRAFT_1201680 [Mycena vulgaris]
MNFLAQSFVPFHAPNLAAESGHHSIIIGGPIMYLTQARLGLRARRAPILCGVVSAREGLATLVQLFVCPEHDCYNTSTTYSTDTRSWIVCVATVPIAAPPSGEPQLAEARTKIEQGPGLLPARVVETWVAGKPKTLDQELVWGQEDSEEFYTEHEPEPGLKLLSHSVRDGCRQAGAHEHPDRRELIQLGDQRNCEWDEDEALAMMSTIGNTWIEQCVDHPEVLTLTMSGNW